MTDQTSETRKLLESLYLRTIDGKIDWSYDSAEDLCEANVGRGFIQIVQETDEDGDYFTIIKVMNEKKEVIDRITGGYDLSRRKPVYTSHDTYWDLIRELKIKAERKAKGADVVVRSILDDLGADKLDIDSDNIPF